MGNQDSNGDVILLSNELEFNLSGIGAQQLLSRDLPLVREVNPRDIIELNVSLARDIEELNRNLSHYLTTLIAEVESLGGRIYGGSSLLEDVSDVEPARYRTTSLSESCARGFLDITSQQIILGVNNEHTGFEIYNYFLKIAPALIALTASSPYAYCDGLIVDTGLASRRASQYERICARFPNSMWRDHLPITSIGQYYRQLQQASDDVISALRGGRLDANWGELTRTREKDGTNYSYFPFTRLEPHQVYWTVRLRPDHSMDYNGSHCPFSVEIRTPDMPTTTGRMRMLNALVAGLAYCIADKIPMNTPPFLGLFEEIKEAACYGLSTVVNSHNIGAEISLLAQSARRGLEERGYKESISDLDTVNDIIFRDEGDYNLIRRHGLCRVDELRDYLSGRLKKEISMILILNCDTDENIETNGAQILLRSIDSLDNVVVKNVFEMEFPTIEDTKSATGIIITGSRKSVYENDKWIDMLLQEIRKINLLKIPTLGICFGFQAIAKALGGNVEASDSFEEGFMPVEITDRSHFLFDGLPDNPIVYHSHCDVISIMPPKSKTLARNSNSVQAYSVNNFLCTQFHPEISAKIALKMAIRDGKNVNEILNGVTVTYDLPSHILKNFISYCTK